MRALERGLEVIRALGRFGDAVPLAEVARRSGLPASTARRFLSTLVDIGYVHHDGSRFALTPRAAELGRVYLDSIGLFGLAGSSTRQVADRTRECCGLAVLDGNEAVCVASARPERIVSPAITVGTRLPAKHSAAGRALSATVGGPVSWGGKPDAAGDALPRGYALSTGEFGEHLVACAAPVHAPAGVVIGALFVVAPGDRLQGELAVRELAEHLRGGVARLECALRASPGSPVGGTW